MPCPPSGELVFNGWDHLYPNGYEYIGPRQFDKLRDRGIERGFVSY
ncbi:hypothetical protein [Mycolicibacterium gadium]|jgi:hypothetical protein|uniref:Uncharacterized protein n=1 Tax=Mycolicibacterium gadium TaxID=1794 RepID=A0A7I7WT44_MYCGU|nr:hypothetical protein [Mycolicibacterium gadium]BBZ20232.1 hypothetical protein MGAD_45670 [Mycolicibacterium gadium]